MRRLLLLALLCPALAFAQGVTVPKPLSLPKCNSVSTPGNATCNFTAGVAAVAAGVAAVTITNAQVASTSVVIPVLEFVDSTCTSVKTLVPGSGTFTITLNANCTSNTQVGWYIAAK